MAQNVTAQVLGGQATVFNGIETVQDLFNEMGLDGNYAVTVNGDAARLDTELDDFQFVSFAPAVKGGL